MYEQIVYKELCDSITKDTKTDSAKIMQVYEYVSNNCRQPQGNENPKYNTTYDVLTNKVASCDQQVWLMNTMLGTIDISAEMVFLYGYDSISHHTVSIVGMLRYDTQGYKAMLDPFYHLYFLNNDGKIAIMSEITEGNIRIPDNPLPPNYLDLYKPDYPYKRHSHNNAMSTERRYVMNMLRLYTLWLGKVFTEPFKAMHN